MNIFKRIYFTLKDWMELFSMLMARIVACFVDGRGVWIIGEKTDEARDNGYWMYRYLRTAHPNEKALYVIKKRSTDYAKVAQFGEEYIIEPGTFRHKVLFWAAEYNTASQPLSDYSSAYRHLKNIRKKHQVCTFLQHGITKDNLSHNLDYDKAGIDIFVTSAEAEQKAVIDRHGYNKHTCVLTGMCRYDNLPVVNHNKTRKILVMPTFRHWLMAPAKGKPTDIEKNAFASDDYCKTYKSFLTSQRLNSLLEEYDYKLIFYPHYCAQPFLECFDDKTRSNRVILASSKTYDVQSLLIESDILITDFSSIFFDFAYMKKPEIFYQFDEEKYRSGHYEEGYFKYREHAFGPVISEEEDLIDYLTLLLCNYSAMEDKYAHRVDDFFAYRDQKNCERLYNHIVNYQKRWIK